MKKILININGQNACASEIVSVNGTVDVIECVFLFDESWDDYPAKKAHFENDKIKGAKTADVVNGRCVVPWEVLALAGCIRVAVEGSNTNGQVERTEAVLIVEQCKTITNGTNTIEPTPDQYAQYVDEVGGAIAEYFDDHKSEFKGDPGEPGTPGEPGADGYTPTATVTEIQGGATITITDADGTTEAVVMDGEKGDDGISPTATVTKSGNKSTLTVEDKNGTTRVEILDGAKGDPGEKGSDYVITEADKHEIADEVEGKYTEELADVKESLNQKADKTETDKRITDLERKNDALWKLSQGQTYDFQTVDGEYYEEVVPSGGHYFEPKMVGGKSVVWNHYGGDNYHVESGATVTRSGDEFVFSNTVDTASIYYVTPIITGHKYYCTISVYGNYVFVFSLGKSFHARSTENTWTKNVDIVEPTADRPYVYIYPNTSYNPKVTDVRLKDINIIDLTQMFGTGNEPTTTDDPRIKWIERYVEEHPEYNGGEIVSAEIDGIVERGVNLWDEEWEVGSYNSDDGSKVSATDRIRSKNYIMCKPNTQYFYAKPFESGNMKFIFYDANKTYCGSYDFSTTHYFTTPANCHYMTFFTGSAYGTTYKNDISIIEGTSGTYKPYKNPTTYDLPNIELRSAGTVHDEIDIERGVVVRRVGVVDLGTLNWKIYKYRFYYNLTSKDSTSSALLCDKYANVNSGDFSGPDKSISSQNGDNTIIITDSAYSDTSSFKVAMSGVECIYKLAEPYEEPITVADFDLLPCEPNGSLTFENSLHIPIPSSVEYTVKLSEV